MGNNTSASATAEGKSHVRVRDLFERFARRGGSLHLAAADSRCAPRIAVKGQGHGTDDDDSVGLLGALPDWMLAECLFPLLPKEDMDSLRCTCKRMRDAYRTTATHLTLIVSAASLRHLGLPYDTVPQPRRNADDDGAPPQPPAPSPFQRLFPALRHLVLRPATRFDAIACATPCLYGKLLPAGLLTLVLDRWSLHDQAAQVAAIAAAVGPSLVAFELRDPYGIQDLGALLAGAAWEQATALRSIRVTPLQPHPGGRQRNQQASSSARRGTPLQDSGGGLVRRVAVVAGDGSRANDPLLQPHAWVSKPGGREVLGCTEAWSLRSGREWASWHAPPGTGGDAATSESDTASESNSSPTHNPTSPQLADGGAASASATAVGDATSNPHPPPSSPLPPALPLGPPPALHTLELHSLRLGGTKALAAALERLGVTLASLELVNVTTTNNNSRSWTDDPRDVRGNSDCVTMAVAAALPKLRRLRALRLNTQAHPHQVAQSYGGSGTVYDDPAALAALVDGVVSAGRGDGGGAASSSSIRNSAWGWDQGAAAGGDGAGAGMGVSVLCLPAARLPLPVWRRLLHDACGLRDLELHSVEGYDGLMPPGLRRLTIHDIALAEPQPLSSTLQASWAAAPLLEECHIGFTLLGRTAAVDADGGQAENGAGGGAAGGDRPGRRPGPAPARRATLAEQSAALSVYAAALSKVPRVWVGVHLNGSCEQEPAAAAVAAAAEPAAQLDRLLQPLSAIPGLQQLRFQLRGGAAAVAAPVAS